MTTTALPTTTPFAWQDEKRLRSGDRIWILTDIDCFSSAMCSWSTPQRWYRVGGLDLASNKLGYFTFTTDDVRALLRAGLTAAPWRTPQATGIELTRLYHGNQEKGRFREVATLIELDPKVATQGAALRRYFERHLSFTGNSATGMWQQIEDRVAELRAIEDAALSMAGWFAAGDVKAKLGKDVNVTPTLALLVEEGRLVPNGKKKRGARYIVAQPAIMDRVDWAR